MDAGGRVTPGAVTEGGGEGFFAKRFAQNEALQRFAPPLTLTLSLKGRGNQIAALVGAAFFFGSTCAYADALVDPTRPAFAPTKSSPTARSIDPVSRVTAIFQSGERRVAVIDGQVVKAGDRIGDVVIQEILVDGVRFMRGGRVEVARLPKPAVSVRSDARKASVRSGE
jgi:hypothetical protein